MLKYTSSACSFARLKSSALLPGSVFGAADVALADAALLT
jgi:hypothetical protein